MAEHADVADLVRDAAALVRRHFDHLPPGPATVTLPASGGLCLVLDRAADGAVTITTAPAGTPPDSHQPARTPEEDPHG